VPVVVVPDWVDTFSLPSDLHRAVEPGPAWMVPAGVVAGLALVAVTWFVPPTSKVTFVIAWLTAAVGWAVLASARGPARRDAAAIGVFTAGWIWGVGCWSLGVRSESPGDRRWLIGVAFLAVGVVGQLVASARLHRLARHRQAALGSLEVGGTRTDGWIVAFPRPALQRGLTLEAADGSGRTWSAVHRAWRSPRPMVGHPVAIWATADGDAVVVLTPRVSPA
jgi:hypothetical protein